MPGLDRELLRAGEVVGRIVIAVIAQHDLHAHATGVVEISRLDLEQVEDPRLVDTGLHAIVDVDV